MSGFFNEIEVDKRPLHLGESSCKQCGLSSKVTSPKMPYSGECRKGIYIVSEVPTKTEDATGRQFSGTSGTYLRDILNEYGLDLNRDCRYGYAVRCKTPECSSISDYIKACQPSLLKDISEYKPKLVLLLGAGAVRSFILPRVSLNKSTEIKTWRGFCIPDQEYKAWLCPSYAPGMINFERKDALSLIVMKDLTNALEHLDKPILDYAKYLSKVTQLTSNDDIIRVLTEFSHGDALVAFDYEATGLKLYRSGHRIISCGIARGKECYAFMYNDALFEAWRTFLKSETPKTVAHAPYEQHASKVMFKTWVNNLVHDTVLAAHVLDNRSGISGLKFQTYVNFGIADYDSNMKAYKSATDKEQALMGSHAFNRMERAPVKTILTYNGLDALWTLKLAVKQMRIIQSW